MSLTNIPNAATWQHKYITELAHFYDTSEAAAIFKLCAEALTDKASADAKELQLRKYLKDLALGKPVQQIVGQAYFWDSFFKVNEHTLIPRPETEELVLWIQKTINANRTQAELSFVDIGTGTGCIPITLQKMFPKSKVMAIDIAPEALAVAIENNALHNTHVQFEMQDILAPHAGFMQAQWDIIISNPPYIMEDEKTAMHQNVLDFEPHLALFVTDGDPLQFYKAVAKYASQTLKKDGCVFLELNPKFALETEALFIAMGYLTEIREDMQYKKRMLRAHKPF